MSVKIFNKQIKDLLSIPNRWPKYKGTLDNRLNDNNLMQENIEVFLGTERWSLNKFLKRVRLKAMAQIVGIAGYGIFDSEFPETPHRVLHESGVSESISLPNFKDPNVTDFSSWDQREYLLYHLCFLIECYLLIGKKRLRCDVGLDSSKVGEILQDEILITINAYWTRIQVQKILEASDPKDALQTYFQQFINLVLLEDAYEYSIPCGSKGHAVYITLLYFKIDHEIRIRVDDSSTSKTVVVGRIDTKDPAKIHNLVQYLSSAVSQLLQEYSDTAIDVICDTYDDYKFSGCPNDYEDLVPQTAPNCVVEGFRRSMWYRLRDVYEIKGDTLYRWLMNQTIIHSVVSHSTPVEGTYAKQMRIRNQRYQSRSIGIETPIGQQSRDDDANVFQRSNFLSYVKDLHFKETHLRKLELEMLNQSTKNFTLCAITGVMGCGKTELSKVYLHNHLMKHSTCFGWYWKPDPHPDPINTRVKVSYRQAYDLLLSNFGIQQRGVRIDTQEVNDRQLLKLWEHINQYEECIMVFDNSDSYLDIQQYLLADFTRRAVILVTTQNENFINVGGWLTLSINKGLEPKDAKELLTELCDIKESDEVVEDLLEILDHSPLAIRVCAGYMTLKRNKVGLLEYTTKVATQPQFMQNLGQKDLLSLISQNTRNKECKWTLHRGIELLLTEMQDLNPLFFTILQHCAYLANDNIPEKLLQKLDLKLREKFASTRKYQDIQQDLQQMVNESHSLLTGNSSYYLHRTTQLVMQNISNKSVKKDYIGSFIQTLVVLMFEIYPYDHYSINKIQSCQDVQPHFLALSQVIRSNNNLKLVHEQLRLLLILGQLSYRFSRFSLGLDYLRRALNLVQTCKKCNAEIDAIHAEILRFSGNLKYYQGLHSEARVDLCKAIPIASRAYKPPEWRLAAIYNDLGDNLRLDSDKIPAQNRYQAALNMTGYDLSTKRSINHSRDSELQIAHSLLGIALCYRDSNNFDGAAKYMEEALHIRQLHLDAKDPHIANVYLDLATLGLSTHETVSVEMQRDLDLKIGRKNKLLLALDIYIKAYGDTCHQVATTYRWLTLLSQINGEIDNVREYSTKELKVRSELQ